MKTKIHGLLSKVWKFEVIPEAWKRGLIIKLQKKGNLKDYENSIRITLFSDIGKVLGRIVIDKVRNGVDKRLGRKRPVVEEEEEQQTKFHSKKHHRRGERMVGDPLCELWKSLFCSPREFLDNNAEIRTS